ncbi:MAG: DNA-binding protein [Pseudomonadota bacterium]
MAITKDQIFAVADELDRNGQNPTLASVRKIVGGGSFTTISEAMNEWRARKRDISEPVRQPTPQALGDSLQHFGTQLWAAALELANGRLKAEREALEASRVQLEAEKKEAADLADQMTAELEVSQQLVTTLTAEKAAALAAADGLRRELQGANDRAATAEVRINEIEKRADNLNAELVRVHQQNAELVKAFAEGAKPRDAKK